MCLRLVLFDNAREQGWQRKRLPLIKEVMSPNIGRFGISLSWMRFEEMRRRLPRCLAIASFVIHDRDEFAATDRPNNLH
jgi:hypothetical protein